MNTQTETPVLEVTPEQPPKSRRWVAPLLIVALIAAMVGLLASGIVPRIGRVKQLEQAAASGTAKVTVAIATPAEGKVELVLPSSVEAAQETPLYPRVNGYVKRIVADIGARVQAGDVLAEIETPELDEQVNQAKASVEQAAANLKLAETSSWRWEEMQKNRIVAAQEVDERKAARDARLADHRAALANLQRLHRMQDFQKITAPFSGTVTKRFVEVGQLVTGDLNDTTRILFQVAQTASLRAFINVPQSVYRSIATGQQVEVSFRELPGKAFPGSVARTAGALDQSTRTLRTEVRIPNESGDLVPGLFAEVKFQIQRDHPLIAVPVRALILQSSGPQIAVVDHQNRVSLHSVTLGRDNGKTVEIETGLTTGARFITNPSDTLREGAVVQIDTPAGIQRLAMK
jgi:membrane fusion protein, multidrug efflux system